MIVAGYGLCQELKRMLFCDFGEEKLLNEINIAKIFSNVSQFLSNYDTNFQILNDQPYLQT